MLNKWQLSKDSFLQAAGFFIAAAIFFLPFSITGKTIAIVMALVCVVCSGNWREKILQIINNKIAWAALLLFVMFFIGVFYSQASLADSCDILKKYTRLLYIPLFIPVFIAKPHWVKYLLYVLIASCLLVVLSGILSMTGTVDVAALFHKSAHNPQFPFMISDFILALSIFFLAHLFCDTKTPVRWFYLASLLFIAYYDLIVSNKRTGYISVMILAVVFLYQRLSRKQFFAGVAAVVVLAIGLFSFSTNFKQGLQEISQTIESVKNGNHVTTSTGLRIIFVEKSFAIWKEAPIFGHGTGSFKQAYIKQGGPNAEAIPASMDKPLNTPHNEYANIAVQLGLVGLSLFCLLLVIAFYYTKYMPQLYRYCMQGLVIAFAFGSLSGSYLFYTAQGDFFVIFCAAFASQIMLHGAALKSASYSSTSVNAKT